MFTEYPYTLLHFNTKIKIDTLHIISRELIEREMFHIFKENLKQQLSVFLVIGEGVLLLKSQNDANGIFNLKKT